MSTPGRPDPVVPDAGGPTPAVGRRPVADVLARGEMEVHGRIAGSSNATLLVTCRLDGDELMAVYKPARGERPLWDFPTGLHRREVAAFELARALGWDIVPETVERTEAPFGPGSVQRFVPEDGRSHYFTLRDDPTWHPVLVTIAAFDVVANNADRKSGHVLSAEDRLWAIDNGLCFHHQEKLRTVIWDFAGHELPSALLGDLRRLLAQGWPDRLARLLERHEIEAMTDRAAALADSGCLPEPDDDGHWPPYPWPLV
ncbi:MAG TPA: SCO1664 family protein [Acidimicrobiales bacterium]|nr:SCO1664 family protein [Acidimicrobiales bacterium]